MLSVASVFSVLCFELSHPVMSTNTHLCPLLLGRKRGRQWLEMERKRIAHLWASGML